MLRPCGTPRRKSAASASDNDCQMLWGRVLAPPPRVLGPALCWALRLSASIFQHLQKNSQAFAALPISPRLCDGAATFLHYAALAVALAVVWQAARGLPF